MIPPVDTAPELTRGPRAGAGAQPCPAARRIEEGAVRLPQLPARFQAATITPDAVLGVSRVLPLPGVLHTWRVLRCLVLWISADRPRIPPFNADGMEKLEAEILTSDYADEIRLPVAVIARALTPGAEAAEAGRLPHACLCVAEWALGQGLDAVATSFADASALASGHPAYAVVAAGFRRAVRSRGAAAARVAEA